MADKRIFIPDGMYHIYNRGNNGNEIFHTDKDRYVFLKILKSAVDIYGFAITAYCLMNNHIHIEIIDNGISISNTMRDIQSKYTKYYNSEYNLKGHLFQGPYQFSNIYNLTSLFRVLRYISRNPFKANIVTDPFEYFWSGVSYENDIYRLIDFNKLFVMYDEIYKIDYYDFIRKSDDDYLLAEVELHAKEDAVAQSLYEKILETSGFCGDLTDSTIDEMEKIINACRYQNISRKQISRFSELSLYKIDSIKKTNTIYI